MDIAQLALGNLIGVVAFGILIALVMKTFQIANTLNEIKDQLIALKRDSLSDVPPATPFPTALSGEEMLRAVSAELEHESEPAVGPAISSPVKTGD
jgi:hypothetical protein